MYSLTVSGEPYRFCLGTVSKLSFNASDHCRVKPAVPRRVPSAGGHCVRHLGLTNHARDVVLINQ